MESEKKVLKVGERKRVKGIGEYEVKRGRKLKRSVCEGEWKKGKGKGKTVLYFFFIHSQKL